jgi:uncharacterized membrane protein
MEAFLALVVFGVFVLALNTRSRLKGLEWRLRLVEEELRRRIALGKEVLPAAAEDLSATSPLPLRGGDGGGGSPDRAELAGASPHPNPSPEGDGLFPPQPRPEPVAAPAEEAPAAPTPAKPSGISFNFEELFGRKLPIWAGGITLAVAGVLIVKYAIDIGLFGRIFTPPVQAIAGLLFGFGLISGAEWAHRRREEVDDPRVAQALSGAGISTLYAVVLVAANAYQLISPLTAFVWLAVVTAMALGLSLRHGAPSALLGLAGGLAAPALTVGLTANVPMLALYMAFTIAGLVGVSRAQRWPWLALIALIGGAGWSLWLILAGEALTVMGTLSIGMFVLLLAVAAPLFAFEGARGVLLRTVSALVGAAQLGLLVALGGFAPLDWGLFALIAAACQWLAWRDESLRIVPTISAALSVLLLLIWPGPEPRWLSIIGLALAAIHAVPLLARLWREPRVGRAVELAGIAFFAPIVVGWHSPLPDAAFDLPVALTAALAALVLAAAAALGWKVEDRRDDSRFAWLSGTAGVLAIVAAAYAFAHWQTPLYAAIVAIALAVLSRRAGDNRLEGVTLGIIVFGVLLLGGTDMQPYYPEWARLVGPAHDLAHPLASLRWAGLATAAIVLACLARRPVPRGFGEVASAALAYGTLAQLLPEGALPLIAPAGALTVALIAGRAGENLAWPRSRWAMLTFGIITLSWAFVPLAEWLREALLSLGGVPMLLRSIDLAAGEVVRRLFAPAVLLAAGLWLLRGKLARAEALAGAIFTGALGVVALHSLYRLGFAAQFGTDFVSTGLAERTLWQVLVIGAGVILWKRGAGLVASHGAPVLVGLGALHVAWYSLLIHDPLWTAQAVGPVPLANLLLPLFAALPLCVWLLGRMVPAAARFAGKALQPVIMTSVALFAWASLRQAFHGSLLAEPGLGQTEDILRSIVGIALAVGYLLWGIRSRRRDWRIASLVLMLAAVVKVFLFDARGLEGLLRIASFVALGFSLIGIGWLYSWQLRGESVEDSSAPG